MCIPPRFTSHDNAPQFEAIAHAIPDCIQAARLAKELLAIHWKDANIEDDLHQFEDPDTGRILLWTFPTASSHAAA